VEPIKCPSSKTPVIPFDPDPDTDADEDSTPNVAYPTAGSSI